MHFGCVHSLLFSYTKLFVQAHKENVKKTLWKQPLLIGVETSETEFLET
jgi:hypothetical protein